MNAATRPQDMIPGANPSALLSSVALRLTTDADIIHEDRLTSGDGDAAFYQRHYGYIIAARNISPDQTVLALGCGVDYGSLILASKAHKVIAISSDQIYISRLNSLISAFKLTNLETVCGEAVALRSSIPGPIDVVVCPEVTERLPLRLQETLFALIGSGQKPFHKGTKLIVSTPNLHHSNQGNGCRDSLQDGDSTRSQIKTTLARHFNHIRTHWQGCITANILESQKFAPPSPEANHAHGEAPARPLGTRTGMPDSEAEILYAIASNSELAPAHSSTLIDQRELHLLESISMAAKQSNRTENDIRGLRDESAQLQFNQAYERQLQQKVKRLMRENEILGARLDAAERQLEDRIRHYETIIKTHINTPLEVKLARKCMEILPTCIRKIIRRVAAVGLAIARG